MNYKDKLLYSVHGQQFPQNPQNQYHTNQQSQFQPKYNQPIKKQERSSIPKGIKNIGNNCYMNSVIQALYSIKIFREGILNLKVNQLQQPKCITAYFIQLFKQLSSPQNYTLDPTDFYVEFLQKNTNFSFGRQEDANEFLLTLFQQFGTDIKLQELENKNTGFFDWISNLFADTPKLSDLQIFWNTQREKENNLITQTFIGVTINTITCNDCKSIQQNYEEFTTINLSFPLTQNQQQSIFIQQLDSFTLSSLLVSQFNKQLINHYQCPKCNSKSNCQQLSIVKYPEIIIFSFKRFLFKNEFETQRINTDIVFPIEQLELSQYCNEKGKNIIYRLQSIIHHLGTCEHGHYYSTCRYDYENWYRFDDSTVDNVNIFGRKYETFGTPTPYMLIYQIKQ